MPRTMAIVSGLLVLAAGLGGSLAQAGEPAVTVPGTRIVLSPPPGFVPSARPVGFVSRSPGAAIAVVESQPERFEATRQAVTRPGELRKHGVQLVEVDQLPGFPYEHVLTYATRQQDKVTIDVWTLVFRHPEVTGMVSGSLARIGSPPATAAAIRAALASVRVSSVSAASLIAALPFAVDAPERFAYRNALGGGQLILKETPPAPRGRTGDVTMHVSLAARDTIRPPDQADFARQRVFGLDMVEVAQAESAVPVTIGGLPAMEIMAHGTAGSGNPRRIYFLAVFAPKAVYTIVATAQPQRFEHALADIRAAARSFRPK